MLPLRSWEDKGMKFNALAIMVCFVSLFACNISHQVQYSLEPVAYSEQLWTGIAVSSGQRIFVNYPRWSPGRQLSVAEVRSDQTILPYPDGRWNNWEPGLSGEDYFVCVQSVYVDREDHLWILDTGVDVTKGIVPDGAKLIKLQLENGQIMVTYPFPNTLTPPGTYLNDVRIDIEHQYAYITDSGRGGLITLDLRTGRCRRLLGDHFSTKSENVTLKFNGQPWLGQNGQPPQIHSDGIAYDPDKDLIYFQALTGRTLYRIPGAILRDTLLSDTEVNRHVGEVAKSGHADGLILDRSGNLYITSIENNAIKKLDHSGHITTVVSDSLLQWPDSFALWQDKTLYVTTSQIHLGLNRKNPYAIFMVQLSH